MIALFANSNTSSNIGNSFFYEGVRYALQSAAARANHDIEIVDCTFNQTNAYGLKGKQKHNLLDYFACNSNPAIRYIILAGPFLDSNIDDQFGAALARARSFGTRIVMLSAGCREYSPQEYRVVSKILAQVEPDLLITRDEHTFELYSKYARQSHNGICFAFFVNDYYQPYATPELDPYITLCFDFRKEPLVKGVDRFIETGRINDIEISGKPKSTKDLLGRISYVFDSGRHNENHDVNVIRLCHRPLRRGRFIFNRAKSFSSFNLTPYLNLYANTRLTVTDRLHSAVATMAYGNYARLFLSSNRTKLLERAGVEKVKTGFYKITDNYINEEKETMLQVLADFFKAQNKF